ncbi:MAG TPA: ATP-NAD kinase family protein [Anaerovoracaceae bacterium]|nr:ATP-NAD kinase family protein [Anaerovoracaceae bacterium]
MKTIGLIINPIAGMGGRVGLKGTDGMEILSKAIQLGASKEAPNIAVAALRKLESIKEELFFLTASFDMGENQCKALDFHYEVIHRSGEFTNCADTIKAAGIMEKRGVDLIVFAGGDGTARDIYRAVGNHVAVLGIPAGVKIYSPVYGNTPQSAGELAFLYLRYGNLPLKEEEVVDLNEEAIRNNQVRAELFGYLKVPFKKEYLQNKKAPTPLGEEESQKAIALDIIDHMQEGEYYLIGPGTTTRAIMEELNLPNTLLGVDIIQDKKLIKPDCSEKDILDVLGSKSGKLIITPTGGQGYLLGRGNQQISPKVLEKIGKENIIILSVNSKIIELQGSPLFINTGNSSMDRSLAGYYRIKVGYDTDVMYKVSDSL